MCFFAREEKVKNIFHSHIQNRLKATKEKKIWNKRFMRLYRRVHRRFLPDHCVSPAVKSFCNSHIREKQPLRAAQAVSSVSFSSRRIQRCERVYERANNRPGPRYRIYRVKNGWKIADRKGWRKNERKALSMWTPRVSPIVVHDVTQSLRASSVPMGFRWNNEKKIISKNTEMCEKTRDNKDMKNARESSNIVRTPVAIGWKVWNTVGRPSTLLIRDSPRILDSRQLFAQKGKNSFRTMAKLENSWMSSIALCTSNLQEILRQSIYPASDYKKRRGNKKIIERVRANRK